MKEVNIRDLKYTINEEGIVKNKDGKAIKPSKHMGYMVVRLRQNNGRTTKCKLHRLIAEAFIPNPFNKPEVNHIDHNKENNNISNLEWVTAEENFEHYITNYVKDDIKKLILSLPEDYPIREFLKLI